MERERAHDVNVDHEFNDISVIPLQLLGGLRRVVAWVRRKKVQGGLAREKSNRESEFCSVLTISLD